MKNTNEIVSFWDRVTEVKAQHLGAECDQVRLSCCGEITEDWHWRVETNGELLGKGGTHEAAWDAAWARCQRIGRPGHRAAGTYSEQAALDYEFGVNPGIADDAHIPNCE